MRLRVEDTIAVCVDYQEKLMPAIHEGEEVLKRAEILIRGLKTLNVPVIVTQQYTRGLGATVEPVHSALGAYEPYEKMTFGAYDTETIREALDGSGRKTALVFGTETHICVLQTALGLREAGYQVLMVEDCCGSRKQADKDCGLKRAMGEGVGISCTESVLFELLHKAGGEAFKTISKLVK